MHDDLKAILRLEVASNGKDKLLPLKTPREANEMFTLAFDTMAANELNLGGVLPTKNPRNATSVKEAVSLDLKFIYDPLHFIISTRGTPLCRHFHFDDAERTINAYKSDGGVVRLNRYAIDSPHEPYSTKASGGLAGQRTLEDAKKAVLKFEEESKD